MTSARSIAYRLRLLILILGIICTIAGIGWTVMVFFNDCFDFDFYGLFGTPLILNPAMGESELGYGINVVIVLGLFLLAQWAFLRPGKGWTVRMTTVGRPLKTSIFAAGLMATLLTTGFITFLFEFPNWWERIMGDGNKGWDSLNHIIIWAVMLIIWGIWTWVFFVYWKQGDRYTQLGKMIRGLIAGSVLETVVAVPVHIWAVRQRNCYCCRGTYTTLILAGTVLIWVFGPGIILLYMREKYRRAKLLSSNTIGREDKASLED